jgi:hypothetical protein
MIRTSIDSELVARAAMHAALGDTKGTTDSPLAVPSIA